MIEYHFHINLIFCFLFFCLLVTNHNPNETVTKIVTTYISSLKGFGGLLN